MSVIDSSQITVGSSPTATNNFIFQTDGAGGMTLKNGDASKTVMSIASSGRLTDPQFARASAKCTLSAGTLTQQKGFNCTVTRSSTGTYAVAFTVAMTDANFSVGMSYNNSGWGQTFAVDSETVNGFRMVCASAAGAVVDPTAFSFVVFD